MSKLLLDEVPLMIMPQLAVKIGLNESIVLQQVHYWLEINKKANKNLRDGFYWTYNSYKEWQEQFPFFSTKTIQRTIVKLEKIDLLISANYNKLKIDRTKWYRINYETLENIGNLPFGQKVLFNESDCHIQESNLTKPLPEIKSEINNKDYQKTNTDFLSKNPRELFYYDNCNHFLDNIFSKIDYDSNFDEELSNAEEMLKYFYHKFYNKYGYPMTSLTDEQETETAKIIDSNLGNMSEIKFCFYYVDYYLAEKRSKTAKDPNKKYHSFIQFIKGLDFEMMSERANKSGVNDIDFSYEENIA